MMSELIGLRLHLDLLSSLPGLSCKYMNGARTVKYECEIVDVKFRVLSGMINKQGDTDCEVSLSMMCN